MPDEIGDDAELRDRLDALLAAYEHQPIALDRPLSPDPRAAADADATRLSRISLSDLGLSILDSLGHQA